MLLLNLDLSMIKVSKKLEYALMSARYFHDHASTPSIGAKIMARDLQIPFDTLSKVFQTLVHAKILHPIHGAQGGHALIIPLKDIQFLDFYLLFEEIPFGQKCNGPKEHCGIYSHCTIQAPLTQLHNQLESFFKNLSLYDFFFSNTK